MKCNRFSEEQIIGILKEHEAGVPVADLCRTHGVSSASIYKWKAKYGGMEAAQSDRLIMASVEFNPSRSVMMHWTFSMTWIFLFSTESLWSL